MPDFKKMIQGMEAKEEAEQPKTRKVGNEEFPAPQKAQVQDSRFLKDDPYYKLVKEKSPMAYREHLYYPENGKFNLHDTKGNKIGEFDDEEKTLTAIDESFGKPKKDNEEQALYQKYLGMGYDKGEAQLKTKQALYKKENLKKEDELQKLPSVSSAAIENGEATIYTSWTRNPRNNYKNYSELRSYLNQKYGEGNYAIDYIRDDTRDNGRETAAQLRVRFF